MTERRVGLVLGGGGARGFGHVAVIEALDELGIVPAAIAGTSIGAIMGASRAGGMSGRAIREHTLETFGTRLGAIARLWSLRPKTISDMLAPGAFALGQLDIEKVIEIYAGALIPARFEDLSIPLSVVTTDYYGGAEVILREGDLRRAVAASAALPMIFRPILHEGRVLIDGGVVNPIPVNALPKDIDIVLAVDVTGLPEQAEHRPLPGAAETLIGAALLMTQAVVRGTFASSPPDIVVRPPIAAFNVLDFLKAREIMDAAEPIKDEVKRRIDRIFSAEPTEIALPAAPPLLEGAVPGKRKRLTYAKPK